jgi:hypothetical protein
MADQVLLLIVGSRITAVQYNNNNEFIRGDAKVSTGSGRDG